jgi:hypothetical protein
MDRKAIGPDQLRHPKLGETVLRQFPRRLSYTSLGSLTKCLAGADLLPA